MTVDVYIDSAKGVVLIVDDTLFNLHMLSKILTDHGYLVRVARSGSQALEDTITDPPDIILLDIIMSEMDGYEVCQRLKANRSTRDIPVIFMSALDEVMDKVRAFSIGAVDYITKPFQAEEVLARVDTHLTLQLLQQRLEMQLLALQRVNAALKESNDELDAFAHTVAHDLKSPLANIVMSAEIAQRYITTTSEDKTLVELVQTSLGTSARKAINIVDELLLLASVRQESVMRRPLDMADIVKQAQNRLGWMVEQYRGEITLPDHWPVASGYAPWVEEVWVNYLSNGLKYGGQPPLLRLGAAAQGNGMVRFWVQDNGAGIAPEELDTLFTEFTRIEHARAEGHGLGLWIVKRIAGKLGGDVGVESQVGEGSTFYFCLPLADS
jgi:signal transduction histidine kinase